MKHMLMVCNQHVKDGLVNLEIPHVKKIHHSEHTCSFCSKKAEIKIYYSIAQKYRKTNFIV
ncbi:hypothetical protein COM86_25805 [Priestia megaterium]|nr:hypothetical protein ASE46_26825 [Bacillus sp. Root239]PEB61148.1 hypothetical protein COM86_25805 [Priestia megaterium]PEE78559.1 hypothetical protein COM81_02000 [Priestia megaterium]PFI82107.1 hypothetical protein COI84_30265 [Priestia megaterium]PGR05557.1 hypothetical protein COC62_28315 [Priestia megaterium]